MGTPVAGSPLTAAKTPKPIRSESDFPPGDWSGADAVIRCRSQLTEQDRQRIERTAFAWGSAPESYDIVISEGSVLETPCGQGILSVLPNGRFWHMSGGIQAPEELKPAIAHWLRDISQQQRKTIAVYFRLRRRSTVVPGRGI